MKVPAICHLSFQRTDLIGVCQLYSSGLCSAQNTQPCSWYQSRNIWGLFSSFCHLFFFLKTSLVAQVVKRLPTMLETWVWSLGREGPLEKEMATHSSNLAWKIPWTEEPGRPRSMGSQRVRHDWVTSLFFFLSSFLFFNVDFIPVVQMYFLYVLQLLDNNFFAMACEILVPQVGIEPRPPPIEVQHLNHWTCRKVPSPSFLFSSQSTSSLYFSSAFSSSVVLLSLMMPRFLGSVPCRQGQPTELPEGSPSARVCLYRTV